MKRMNSIPALLVLAGLLHAPSALAQKELTVQLAFVPQEGVQITSPDLTPALLEIAIDQRIEDARRQEDQRLIGRATGRDDKPFPVRADRDVTEFVRETLAMVGREWSLKLEKPHGRSLTLQIARFWVDENRKAVGSMYGAEVKLAFALKDASDRLLSEGIASGSAHRYGRAHSKDNANEVLSDALKEAYSAVLSDSGLQNAWASGKRNTGASTKAPAPESPEERLRKLDDLLKKGLITKDEYARKREEILSGI
jgi:hypothetical protein